MTVRDLIREEIDIDVCDTYDERCYIAFVGPLRLTTEGETKFSRALDLKVQIHGGFASLLCDGEKDAQNCKELFFSAAGFCGTKEYDRWFTED